MLGSPGVYYKMDRDKTGKELYSSTVIPNRGAWLEYENDINDVFYVRIDKNRKIPVTVFIRSLIGLEALLKDREEKEMNGEKWNLEDVDLTVIGKDSEIIDIFDMNDMMKATIEKDTTTNAAEGLIEVYKKLRPSEPPTIESAMTHLSNLFFDDRR